MCSCVTSLWKVGAISVSLANDIPYTICEIKSWCNDQGRTGNKPTRDTTSKAWRVSAQVGVSAGVTVVGDVESCSYESFLGIFLEKATQTTTNTTSFIWLPICRISPKSCSVWQVFGSCLKHHCPNLLMLICRFSYSLRQIQLEPVPNFLLQMRSHETINASLNMRAQQPLYIYIYTHICI